jgi:hypothetical protein
VDVIAPAAPVAPEPQRVAEAQSAGGAEPESAKVAAAPMARVPAFRALNFVAARGDAVSPARVGLQYTVYKKSPAGDLTEVDPQTELDRSDEVVIRFEAREAGLLSVSQLDVPNGLHVLANDRLLPSVPYTFPKAGSFRSNGAATNEFLVRFSRQPSTKKLAEPAGVQAGAVSAVSTEPAQQATFNITLKYK